MGLRHKIGWLLLGALALVLAVVALYVRSYDWNRLKPWLADWTERHTGEALRIEGDLAVDLGWRPRLRAEGVTYGKLLSLRLFEVQLSLWSLLGGTIDAPLLRAEGGRILATASALPPSLRRRDESPKQKGGRGIPALRVGEMTIREMTVTVPRQGADPVVLEVASLRLHAAPSSGRAVVYGRARLLDQPLLVSGWLDDYARLSDRRGHAFLLAFKLGGLLAEARGSLRSPLAIEGDLHLVGSGAQSIAAAFGRSRTLPPFQVDAALVLAKRRLELENLDVHLGASKVKGRLVVDLAGSSPRLEARLVSELLRERDLSGLLPRRSAGKKPQAGGEEARLFSAKPLALGALGKVEAHLDLRVERFEGEGVSKLLQGLQAKVRLVDGALDVRPLRVDFGGGMLEAEVAMQVVPSGAATLDVDARIERLDLERVTAVFLVKTPVGEGKDPMVRARDVLVGRLGGRLQLKTRFSSLRELAAGLDGRVRLGLEDGKLSSLLVEALGLNLTEAIGTLLAGKKTVDLHCLVADIGIADGIVEPNVVLLATDDSNIWIDGAVDLRDEMLALEIRTLPKDFSIGSLRGPIRIRGDLRKPRVDVAGGEAIARLSAAAILGAVLAPAAAALAFVEPGLGKEGQCARFQQTLRALAH